MIGLLIAGSGRFFSRSNWVYFLFIAKIELLQKDIS